MSTINPDLMRLGGYAGLDTGMGMSPISSEHGEKPMLDHGLTIETAPTSILDAMEEVDPAVEAALTRNDDLGRIMDQIFNPANYPAPAMPKFD